MKIKYSLLLVVAACVGCVSPHAGGVAGTDREKDLCLLYSENCPERADTLQEKIGKLQAEINKGERVYSPEELARLQGKLDEAEWFLNRLLYGPSN